MEKIIGFDMSCIQVGKKGEIDGLTIYTQRVLEELCLAKDSFHIIGIYHFARDFEKSTLELIERFSDKITLAPLKSFEDIGQIIKDHHIDIFYSALPNLRKNYSLDCKKIFSIHGMRAAEMPADKYGYLYCNSAKEYIRFAAKRLLGPDYVKRKVDVFKNFFQYNDSKTKYIINTQHTKFTIMSNLITISPDQFFIWNPPLNHYEPDPSLDIYREYHVLPQKFVLIVMGSRWEKNSYRAIKAMDRLYSLHKDIDMKTIVTGITSNKASILSKIKNKEKFLFVGYIPMGHIQALYRDAFCLLYPSLNEGYGYLPLEVMKYGTPVITSGISAIPEVCQDSVMYGNPYSVMELETRVFQLLFDTGKYNELCEKGKAHYKYVLKQYEPEKLIELFR